MKNKNWIKLISESYIQMNEQDEGNPLYNPTTPTPGFPDGIPDYYEFYDPDIQRIDPDAVRDDLFYGTATGLAYEAFANKFLRGRALSPAVQSAVRGFLLGGAVSLAGFLAALLAAGLTVWMAYELISLLAQAIDDYNGTGPRRIPPILPQDIRKIFPGGVPAPDPLMTPSMLPPGNGTPMLPGQQYPGQHPIGPNGLPYIPVSSPSGSYPPGQSTPMKPE
jgi:hypothetical protein